MEEVIIRPYSQGDRDSVRGLAYDTAFMGDSADIFFNDRQLLEDFLTVSFIDYEPGSCFIAESKRKVVGYLMGLKNTSSLSRVYRFQTAFKLLFKSITHNIIFRRKSAQFLFYCLISFMKGEFHSPDFSQEYPATLHINLAEGFRNQGIGRNLVNVYLEYLVKEKVKGVRLATLSEKAARFYEQLGFIILYKRKRTYFRNILHRDVICYIYGKKF